MKQDVKGILPVLFLAGLSVSSMVTICLGYTMYELGVTEGDWVEYKVMEAENYEFFAEIHSDDRLRFEVVGIEVQEIMYLNGTVAFEVEVPVCVVFLNGECIQRNVTLREMLFLPKGEEYWRALEKIEESWKIEAPKYGWTYESNITIGPDTVRFSYRMENAVNSSTTQTVHKDTGVATEFARCLYVAEERRTYRLVISDTNVSGVLSPWYVTYWYILVLVGAVILLTFVGVLKYQIFRRA